MEELRKKILYYDTEKNNLTRAKKLLSNNFDLFLVHSTHLLFSLIERTKPDLILLDYDIK